MTHARQALGLEGETRACQAVETRGYRILARRWRSPAGEIDIVALRGQTLVFVEVKARATLDRAAEAVTVTQRRRIAASFLHATDLLRQRVALSLQLLRLRLVFAPRAVQFQNIIRLRQQPAPCQTDIESSGVLADETNVVHE